MTGLSQFSIKAFQEVAGIPPGELFSVPTFELEIELQLANHEVKRTVIVPQNLSLTEMHHVIQTAFHWHDVHLHEFVWQPNSDDDETYERIFTAQEDSDFFDPKEVEGLLIDAQSMLKDFICGFDTLWYEYDFGDSWRHKITLKRACTLSMRKAQLTEMIGITPPEDCGGEPGYEDLLRVLNAPSDPEHIPLKGWYQTQTQYRKTFDDINLWLLDIE